MALLRLQPSWKHFVTCCYWLWFVTLWVNKTKMATLRRSSAKLRSLGSGHGDLILTISQWKELRSATKSLMAAQESTANDLLKWSSKEVHTCYISRGWVKIRTIFKDLNDYWLLLYSKFNLLYIIFGYRKLCRVFSFV